MLLSKKNSLKTNFMEPITSSPFGSGRFKSTWSIWAESKSSIAYWPQKSNKLPQPWWRNTSRRMMWLSNKVPVLMRTKKGGGNGRGCSDAGWQLQVRLCLEIVSALRNKVTKESLFQESFRHLLSTSLSGRLDTVKHGSYIYLSLIPYTVLQVVLVR